MELWYRQPARAWSEALPLGNGRLGAMVYGDEPYERISMNEDSIWSGRKLLRNNPDALENLPRIRQLIRGGKLREAERLAMAALSGTPQSARVYQPAGDLLLHVYAAHEIPFGQYPDPEHVKRMNEDRTAYRRSLDLEIGTARVDYTRTGVTFHRLYGASHPDGVIFIHLWTDEKIPFSFDCHMERCRNFCDESVSDRKGGAKLYYHAPEGGISFCNAFRIEAADGKISNVGEFVCAENVTSATIWVDSETSFRHCDYAAACDAALAAAMAKGYEAVYRDHCADFAALFNRMSIRLNPDGQSAELAALPTDERLRLAATGGDDPGLFETYFQFARYLMIAGSRPGSLPLTLQGIWNDQMIPAWDSKYTININLEMNYWMAEAANLSECPLPFFDLLERVKENGKATARVMYGCRGSVAHHNTDLYADTAPQDICISSTYWVLGEAWMATHIWQHYLYTGDRKFLREHFDVLRQTVLFFEDFLTEDRDGYLSVSPSVSPENTYELEDGTRACLCDGCAMDTEILTGVFTSYLRAAGILAGDGEIGATEGELLRAREVLKRLPPLRIGTDGRLCEWNRDYKEPEPGHRHVSHLYGVFPGSSISEDTPELMQAARKSLNDRLAHGGGHTGWSRAWIILLRAFFREGDEAYDNLRAILRMGTFPNLMDTHPMLESYVFQIDGNMGAAEGIIKMLVQSREGVLDLLPALPAAWPSGEVRGMRICGGASLDMTWQEGRVTRITILPERDFSLKLRANGGEQEITLHAGEAFLRTWG